MRDHGEATSTREFFFTAQQLRNGEQPGGGEIRERNFRRSARSIAVSVQPLDDDFQPCGDRIWVVSRDVSLQGVGLISHEPFSHKYVRLGLTDQEVTTIGEVVHNTPIGRNFPLYLVGVSFKGRKLDANGELF